MRIILRKENHKKIQHRRKSRTKTKRCDKCDSLNIKGTSSIVKGQRLIESEKEGHD